MKEEVSVSMKRTVPHTIVGRVAWLKRLVGGVQPEARVVVRAGGMTLHPTGYRIEDGGKTLVIEAGLDPTPEPFDKVIKTATV